MNIANYRGKDGYIADLLTRMTSEERLPQSGPLPSSEDWVSWQAFREAEELDDLATLPQIEAEFLRSPPPDRLMNLAFILAGLIANTRSLAGIALFLRMGEATPDDPINIHSMISYAEKARISECRAFALSHLETKHRLVLGQVISYLGKLGDPGDIAIIGSLLDEDCWGLGCGFYCAIALKEIGHPDALPYLRRAVDRHRKARKKVDKDTRNWSAWAIEKIMMEKLS